MMEDEAKTKWCPFSRYASPHGATSNREGQCNTMHPHMEVATRCIGSACMAWRKTGAKFKDGTTGYFSERDLTGHGKWIDDGHCGLAGNPNA